MGKKSNVWYYFIRKTKEEAECMTCHKTLKCGGGSTSTLSSHIKNIHGIELNRINQPFKKRRSLETSVKKKSIEEEIAKLACVDGLSFQSIAKSEFIQNSLRKIQYDKPQPTSPNGVRKMMTSFYEKKKAELTDYFKNQPESATMSNVVPSIGKPAPSFRGTAVINGEFREISLQDYEGKYLVLFFYPLDFTFVCPTEIIAFSDRVQEFRDIGCEVVACSTDSHFSHLAWVNTSRKEGGLGHMDIPILADKSMDIGKAYGVLKEEDGITFRGLFVIDGKQNLRQVTVNDLPVGRDVDETLRLVQAFQFTDEHGEVCPAGWKPGSKTMKADPEGSKDYFASQN